jgi:uncharacterized repeat protein (TIGR03803 family)
VALLARVEQGASCRENDMSMVARSMLLAVLASWIAAACPASARDYQVEYRFKGGRDGAQPVSRLIDVGGKLYGTTTKGGTAGLGVVFSYDPSTGAETNLYSFKGGADGAGPSGALVKVGAKLYGVTGSGGAPDCYGDGCGTVFSFDPRTGDETVLHAFTDLASRGPYGLTSIGDTLYGATYGGGRKGGTVFAFDIATGATRTLHTFTGGGDGFYPSSGVTAMGGMLYGVTQEGGANGCGCGVLYRVDPASHTETVLYDFKGGTDGEIPYSDLTAVGGVLYGTTIEGGAYGAGTVYAFNPAGGGEQVIYTFKGDPDAGRPFDGSVVMVGGILYGVSSGGGQGYGTIYSLDPSTGAEQVLHIFDPNKSSDPYAGLLYTNHRLFGTLSSGDPHCDLACGALFSIKP